MSHKIPQIARLPSVAALCNCVIGLIELAELEFKYVKPSLRNSSSEGLIINKHISDSALNLYQHSDLTGIRGPPGSQKIIHSTN